VYKDHWMMLARSALLEQFGGSRVARYVNIPKDKVQVTEGPWDVMVVFASPFGTASARYDRRTNRWHLAV
jgi:hypothetical protein